MASPDSNSKVQSRIGRWYKKLILKDHVAMSSDKENILGSQTHPARWDKAYVSSETEDLITDTEPDTNKGVFFLAKDILDCKEPDNEDILDKSPINLADCGNTIALRRLRSLLFQLYCMTAQCSICLGSLGSNKDSEEMVEAPFGKDIDVAITKSSVMLSWQPNIENDKLAVENDKLAVENDKLAVGCLPCGHFYCRGCLDNMVKIRAHSLYGSVEAAPEKLRIRCPLCRKKVKCTNVCNIST